MFSQGVWDCGRGLKILKKERESKNFAKTHPEKNTGKASSDEDEKEGTFWCGQMVEDGKNEKKG